MWQTSYFMLKTSITYYYHSTSFRGKNKNSFKKPTHQMHIYFKINLICQMCVLVTQSQPTLFNPMDCSPPGSSVHGILQARILE